MTTAITEKAKNIKAIVFDIDGVMTDGKLYFSASGDTLKAFNAKDGLGIKMLMAIGIEVGIITGRQSDIVSQRAKELGIPHVYQGQGNKLDALDDLQQKLNLNDNDIAYMGDDINDVPVLKRVGFAIAPANSFDYVQRAVDYVCQYQGGDGAVREACDFILHAKEQWHEVIKHYGN